MGDFMTTLNLVVTKAACGHIKIQVYSGGVLRRTFHKTLSELKEMAGNIENEDMLLAQLKKVITDNPSATPAQLKALIEAEAYYI